MAAVLRHLLAACALSIALASAASAPAQDTAPVTLSDSPVAWQLLQQAFDQARDNPGEAARIAQRLLDGYADRIVPADDPPEDRFESVVDRVERFLRAHPATLDRYRRGESAEAARLLAAGRVAEVARSRALTPSGLEAHLALAEREIDRGRLGVALLRLARIENHPDLGSMPREAALYWHLRGLAATFEGRSRERDEALARLEALRTEESAAARAALARLAGAGPARIEPAIGPLDAGVAPTSEDGEWQPVWTERFAATPYARAVESRLEIPFGMTARDAERARFDASLLVLAPTAWRDAAIVFDGVAVRAMDRLSRRTLWSTDLGDAGVERGGGGRLGAIGGLGALGALGDIASIAIGEGALVVFPGHAAGNERGTAGRVACLDATTGGVRWQATLSRLLATEEEVFPIGEPAIADGAVHLLARKVTSRLETVEYAIALELADGSLRWSTHVASCGGVRIQGLRAVSRPVIAEGSLWIATSVGAAARLDLGDGRILWLRRFLVPVREVRYPSEPWEVGGPALVGPWMFAIAPDQSEVVQLDRSSGRSIRAFPTGATNAWGAPRYLIADPPLDRPDEGPRRPRIYAVGADIVAIDTEDPARQLWSFSDANADRLATRAGAANRAGIRGRVQLAGERLVVPGLEDVLLVSRDTGRVRESIAADGPANPVLVGAQLLLGGNAAVTALMPAASAERLMRERIAARPQDPEGALALLDLGLRTRRLALCVEAGELASAALERRDASDAREELVARLLRATALPEAGGADAAPLHAMLTRAARTPSQQVRVRLAEGDWLAADGRADAAARRYAEILRDPRLRAELVANDGSSEIAADALAMTRLEALPADARRSLEREAAASLAAIGDDAEALIEFAAAHAGSALADEAILRLARPSADATPDARFDVLAALLAAVRAGGGSSFEILATRGERDGWSRSVAEASEIVLHRILRRGGDRAGDRAEPASRAMPPAVRMGTEPGEAFEIEGRVARYAAQAEVGERLGGILFASERGLSFRTAPALDAAWSIASVDRDPLVLLAGGAIGARLLVWQEAPDGDAFASLIDAATGELLSRTPPLREILPPEALLDAGRPAGQLMPNEAPYLAAQVLPIVAGRHLVLVRRNGDAVGFRLDGLATPAWSESRLLDQIYDLSAQDWGIAIGGRLPGRRGGGAPAVAVFDPASGTLVARRTLGEPDAREEDIRWLRLVATGELIVGSFAKVEALDALDGSCRVLWRSSSPLLMDSIGSWRFGDSLLVADRGDGLAAIDLRDGTERPEAFRPPVRSDLRPPTLRGGGRAGPYALVQFEDRVLLFGLDGSLRGEDAVADDRNYLFVLPVEGAILVVNALGSRQVPSPLTGGMRTEFAYLAHRLSLDSGLRIEAPAARIRLSAQRCERAATLPDLLLLSTATSTLAVPFRDPTPSE